MVKELLTSWFSDNKVKITSPVLGSFMGAWVLFNWKNFLLLFWGAGTLEVRLEAFESLITFCNYSIWLWPLLVALIYAFVLPYLNIISQKILGHADKIRHHEIIKLDIEKAKQKSALNEEIYKGDPSNLYLGKKLEAELKQKDADVEKSQAESEKAIADKKEAIAQQEKIEAETKQEKLKADDAQRKDEREQQAHALSKSRHHQEVVNNNFPTLYLFLDVLSKSLMEDDLHLSIGLMSEAIATGFGYDDVDSMLTDKAFSLVQLESLACVIYEDANLLSDLKNIITKHGESIDEGALFDHLIGTFEQVDIFKFINPSSMDDIVKDFIDDSSHFYDIVHDEHVGGATAETNAHSFGVEEVLFNGVMKTNDGEYVADAIANIQGEMDSERPYSGHEIDANIQLIYKPIIGRNGYATPNIEVESASLNREY